MCCASTPLVEENECFGPCPSIMIQDTAGGIVRGNRVVGARGIVVLDSAHPLLEENEFLGEQPETSPALDALVDPIQTLTSVQLKKRRLQ